ncbi:MAG: ATP-binding cassette domain-containing protein [Eubacteriales bacterium]|nr:ATP-binding cassette domain-containing protein [Eubacteriales bacterium]
MSDIVISLRDVTKRYGMSKVLKGVNLDIEKGEIYGLIGKNGSGKTTIFKTILGLSEFQGGTLFVGDEGDTLKQGRAKIGFFIGTHFFPYMTAKQNLKYYCKLKGVKGARAEINRVLEIVGLKDVKSKFKAYSLGMKQRLGVAAAMLGNPEIIILDEPTNGLDPQGIADVRNVLKKLNEEYGTTIVISSHILGELQNTAHRFAILNDGVIANVFSQEDLSVESEYEYIKLKSSDIQMAKEVLEHVGIEIQGEKKETVSLEDYYFNVVGGQENE